MLRHCTAYDQGIARIGLIRNLSRKAVREESGSLRMDLGLRVCCSLPRWAALCGWWLTLGRSSRAVMQGSKILPPEIHKQVHN